TSISYANALSTADLALDALISSTPTQIECSEDAWDIRITFISLVDKASNNRLENPGIPTIPLPSYVINEILLMLEIPRIIFPFLWTSGKILVPAASGANVFFTITGMPLLITG